jgi:glycosyltransferase involved in cell wall biosynthesis
VARRLADDDVTAPIVTILTGVDVPPHIPEERRRARRQDLLAGAAGPLILAVGRLAREKNVESLLRAFALIARKDSGAALCLVGDGDERGPLAKLARTLGIHGRVRFVGAVPHDAVSEHYAAADIFAFPSISETQGLVVLEALAHGLPVLAAHSPAVEGLLEDGKTARVVPPTASGLAAGLRDLIVSPDLRARLGTSGRGLAAAHPFEATVERHVEAYRSLLRAAPLHAPQ